MYRIVIVQTFLVTVLTILFAATQGAAAAKAALFGGMIAILNSLLLLRHKRRTTRLAADDAQGSVRIFFTCAAERFFLTVILFATGLGALKLMPVPLLSCFIAGIAGSLLASFKQSGLD